MYINFWSIIKDSQNFWNENVFIYSSLRFFKVKHPSSFLFIFLVHHKQCHVQAACFLVVSSLKHLSLNKLGRRFSSRAVKLITEHPTEEEENYKNPLVSIRSFTGPLLHSHHLFLWTAAFSHCRSHPRRFLSSSQQQQQRRNNKFQLYTKLKFISLKKGTKRTGFLLKLFKGIFARPREMCKGFIKNLN